jgi:hypothetical protein
MKKLAVLCSAAALTATKVSYAVLIAFGTDPNTAPTQNAALSFAAGSSTPQTIYVWARASGSKANTSVSCIAFNIDQSGTGAVTASNFAWDANYQLLTNTPSLNTTSTRLISGANSAGNGTTSNTAIANSSTALSVGWFKVASFDVLPTSYGSSAKTANLNFIVSGTGGIAETPTLSTNNPRNTITNGLGFVTGGSTVVGVSNVEVVNTATANTIPDAMTSTTPEAVISIAANAPAGPSISITANSGTNSNPISGSGVSFVAGYDSTSADGYVFNFTGANTGKTLVFLGGLTSSDLSGLTGGTILPNAPSFYGFTGAGVVVDLGTVAGLSTSNFTVNLSNFSKAPTLVGAIPEPSSLALVGLLGLPALRRSRRA